MAYPQKFHFFKYLLVHYTQMGVDIHFCVTVTLEKDSTTRDFFKELRTFVGFGFVIDNVDCLRDLVNKYLPVTRRVLFDENVDECAEPRPGNYDEIEGTYVATIFFNRKTPVAPDVPFSLFVHDKDLRRDLRKIADICNIPETTRPIFELACVLDWFRRINGDDKSDGQLDESKLFPFGRIKQCICSCDDYACRVRSDPIDYENIVQWRLHLSDYNTLRVKTKLYAE